jgi:hypothetical protein
MTRLWFVNIALSFAQVSCHNRFSYPNTAKEVQGVEPVHVFMYWPENDSVQSAIKFKTLVNVYGKEIEGILFLKKMDSSLYRATFLAKGALKLFDMELQKDTFQVIDHAPQLSNLAALKTLAKDMQVLTLSLHHIVPVQETRVEGNSTYIKEAKKSTNIFYISKGTQLEELIETDKKNKKNLSLRLDDYQEGKPFHLQLQHARFKMRIDLVLLP